MEQYNVKQLRRELKKIFVGYRSVTKTMRKNLRKIGFHVVEGGKHYKIYNMYNQCVCTISKTPSDFRTGYNTVCKMCNSIIYENNLCTV